MACVIKWGWAFAERRLMLMSGNNIRIRAAWKGAALVAAALTTALTTAVAGAGGALAAPSTQPAQAARGANGASSLVPLRQVGLGWSVAEYSAATVGKHAHKGKITLYAVSPQGRKFAFYSWPAANVGPRTFNLVDWSGDGQRVLVQNLYRFEQISLVTGKVINSFKLPPDAQVIGYTRPLGENLLVQLNGIRRYSLTGKLTKVLTRTNGSPIESPDGTSVIVGTSYGVEQVGNLGGVIKRLHVPTAVFGCNPVRWWNATTVLADCGAKHPLGAAPRLWLFPVKGGRVTALTAQRNGHSEDLGDIDAWKLTSGVYLQALGPCAVVFIATQSRNGTAHQVTIPGVHFPIDQVITGHDSSLLVRGVNECGGGASLLWFNPHTKKVTWVIHSPSNVVGVGVAVPFGRPVS
jgi:hypothetical protein